MLNDVSMLTSIPAVHQDNVPHAVRVSASEPSATQRTHSAVGHSETPRGRLDPAVEERVAVGGQNPLAAFLKRHLEIVVANDLDQTCLQTGNPKTGLNFLHKLPRINVSACDWSILVT